MTINNVAAVQAALDDLRSKTDGKLEDFEAGLSALENEIDRLDNSMKRVGGWQPDNDNIAPNAQALRDEFCAIGALITNGDDSKLKEIQASMSVGSDPDGGYLVLPAVSSTMTMKLFDAVTMRRLARTVTMESGSEWVEPIDADESGAGWVGEADERPETSTPKLMMLKITLDEIYALQKVTQRLLDDSQWNIGAWVVDKITSKFVRTENAAFVNGNGVGKPHGFLSYDSVETDDDTRDWGVLQHVKTGSATDVNFDSIKDLFWAVRAPYRRNAKWVMSSATAGVVDKIKDGNGRYIWRDSVSADLPPTLLGKPVEFEEEMPAVGAGALPIAFGDWEEGYTVIDRPGIKLLRDPLTSKGYTKFYGRRRVGGGVANSEAIKLLKVAA